MIGQLRASAAQDPSPHTTSLAWQDSDAALTSALTSSPIETPVGWVGCGLGMVRCRSRRPRCLGVVWVFGFLGVVWVFGFLGFWVWFWVFGFVVWFGCGLGVVWVWFGSLGVWLWFVVWFVVWFGSGLGVLRVLCDERG